MFKSLEYFWAILLLILFVVVLLLIFLPDFPQIKVNQRQEKAETSRTAFQVEDCVQHIRLEEELLCARIKVEEAVVMEEEAVVVAGGAGTPAHRTRT